MLLDEGDRAGSEQALARAVRREDFGALSWEMRLRREEGKRVVRLERRRRKVERRQQQADERADDSGDADGANRVGERLIRQWEAFDTERYLIKSRLRLGVATSSDRQKWTSISPEESQRASKLRREGEAALRRAAERGSADAANRLGMLAHRDDDFRSDRERAKSAFHGSASPMSSATLPVPGGTAWCCPSWTAPMAR